MTYGQIAILTLIVGVFFTLGAVLGWASWYTRPRLDSRPGNKHGAYPAGRGLIVDDD